MKMLITLCLLCVFALPLRARADVVEFECNVREYGDKYTAFLAKIATDDSPRAKEWREIYKKQHWWEVWSGRTRKLMFSIEEQTSEVLYPPSMTMTLKDKILTLKEFYTGRCGDKAECNQLSNEYEINLTTGQITGTQYAADTSWEPYFKPGEEMWFSKGKCQLVKNPLLPRESSPLVTPPATE